MCRQAWMNYELLIGFGKTFNLIPYQNTPHPRGKFHNRFEFGKNSIPTLPGVCVPGVPHLENDVLVDFRNNGTTFRKGLC